MCALGARVCDVEQEASCYLMLNVEIPLLHVAVRIVGTGEENPCPKNVCWKSGLRPGGCKIPLGNGLPKFENGVRTAIERTDIRSSDAV